MFGVSKSNQGEKIIYLCQGKKELKRRSFGKVDLEDQISKCKTLEACRKNLAEVVDGWIIVRLRMGLPLLTNM